jgi:hypothetical protein
MMKKEYSLGRDKMIAYLSKITKQSDIVSTLYLPPDLSVQEINTALKVVIHENSPAELVETIQHSKTGACLFTGLKLTLILPPVQFKEQIFFQGIETSILSNILTTEYTIGIMLIRLGSYAMAVCCGENIISSKVGTGLVHSRHRQGGSSSQRFRRHRETQIETFLNRVCGHVKEIMGPYIKTFDYVIFGGAWTTIESLENKCPLLQQFEGPLLPPLLDIPDPRQYVLESVIRRLWLSRVVEWQDDEIQ